MSLNKFDQKLSSEFNGKRRREHQIESNKKMKMTIEMKQKQQEQLKYISELLNCLRSRDFYESCPDTETIYYHSDEEPKLQSTETIKEKLIKETNEETKEETVESNDYRNDIYSLPCICQAGGGGDYYHSDDDEYDFESDVGDEEETKDEVFSEFFYLPCKREEQNGSNNLPFW